MKCTYDVCQVAPRTFAVGVKNADGEQVAEVSVTWWREKWACRELPLEVPDEVSDGAIRAVEGYIADHQLVV